MDETKKFYITTPIFYINDKPHVGHAYTTIAADTLARYHRLLGNETFFLTGTDENSQKTVQAAQKEGLDPQTYADKLAGRWQETWKKLNISQDDFIRTTENRHKVVVQKFYNQILEKGDIYKGKYEGLYCVGHEAFINETDLENGVCVDHKTKPEKIVEENYFFKLSKYQDQLLKLYQDQPNFIQPNFRKHEIINFVKSGLEDISISRETVKWGIPTPNDPSQVIYVWFDALINYLSASQKEFWPPDLHIVGKDILRFHTVIWPAMLLSAGYPLPKKVFAHGFFTIDGVKISKSLGNAIDPVQLSEKYGNDALRYYLLKEIPFGNDGDFSFARLKEVYNADLANGLGNLVQRVATLALKVGVNPQEIKADNNLKEIDSYLENLAFKDALEFIWTKIAKVDQSIDQEKPWDLVKTNPEKAKPFLTTWIKNILAITALLEPFLPETTTKIKAKFAENTVQVGSPLFPRITD